MWTSAPLLVPKPAGSSAARTWRSVITNMRLAGENEPASSASAFAIARSTSLPFAGFGSHEPSAFAASAGDMLRAKGSSAFRANEITSTFASGKRATKSCAVLIASGSSSFIDFDASMTTAMAAPLGISPSRGATSNRWCTRCRFGASSIDDRLAVVGMRGASSMSRSTEASSVVVASTATPFTRTVSSPRADRTRTCTVSPSPPSAARFAW